MNFHGNAFTSFHICSTMWKQPPLLQPSSVLVLQQPSHIRCLSSSCQCRITCFFQCKPASLLFLAAASQRSWGKQKPWALSVQGCVCHHPSGQPAQGSGCALRMDSLFHCNGDKPNQNTILPSAPSHSHQDVSTPSPVRAAECAPSPCGPSKAPMENMSVLLLLPFPASAPAAFYSLSPQRCNQEDLLTWKSLDSSPEISLLNFCLILPVLHNPSLPQALTPISACCSPRLTPTR